jgi:5-methylcytosine-specific restriction endonuclease McrA
MARIYDDKYQTLKTLLAMAGNGEDATLLIPDLQRPYIWEPTRVVVLVDSLIRGWPFGTLLTWKVRADDPVRGLARPFWTVVDRTGAGDGQPSNMKHPPAAFHMVLDGQQRVQSLLLAFGDDGSGFKLLDRKWHEDLSGTKPRGPRGKLHWSLGCLCIEIEALTTAYNKTKRATAIDYIAVLKWVVTDDAKGQSTLAKPGSYNPVLERATAKPGKFVRLSRLWDKAPEQAGIDSYQAEEIASSILQEHHVSGDDRERHKRPIGALLLALADVKRTRVTYLELAEYEEASLGSRESYNDAVVNIFTRLNTAGRTLKREDITFAWLKVGWNTACTQNRSAKDCVEDLARELEELSVSISVEEDVVSSISFVWSVSFNSGKLLSNDDLMKGDAIRPMAANVSESWRLVTEAATKVCGQGRERGLRFREHYQSVNALAYLWAWYFAALRWGHERGLNVLEKDSLDKSLAETLDLLMDRWLVCTQWASVWASASAQSLGGYATRLSVCAQALAKETETPSAIALLKQRLESEVKDIEQAAVSGLMAINADDRQQVRGYYTALWIWNRLEQNRWEKVKLALRQNSRRQNSLEVDHIVAYDLWQSKLKKLKAEPLTGDAVGKNVVDLLPVVNELGNCMLLEKNFNISKSNKPLKTFLEEVHEFKDGTYTIGDWAAALALKMPQVDSADTEVELLAALFAERAQQIRGDLEQFVRGTKARIDL